jgi:hypothetical protein
MMWNVTGKFVCGKTIRGKNRQHKVKPVPLPNEEKHDPQYDSNKYLKRL